MDAGKEASSEKLHKVIDRLFHEGTVTAESDGTTRSVFPIGITRSEGESLEAWVIREQALKTIEIGLAYGISALFICGGLLANGAAKARHATVDPFQEDGFGNCALQLLKEAGVINLVEHHSKHSEILLPQFLAEARTFDFAFIDGNHRFEGVFLDLVYLGRLVRPGGIIFLDDYQLPAVAKAASFCKNNLGWTIEEVSPDDALHSWVVLRTAATPLKLPFDHYVDF